MPARTYYTEWAMFHVLACSCPTIEGEVAQSPRAMHTAMPRTITIIPLSDAGVYNRDLELRIQNRFIGEYSISVLRRLHL